MLPDNELVARCVAFRRRINAPLAIKSGEINTDYIEGMNLDGTPNANRKNAFDDLHVVYTFRNGTPFLLHKCTCTTQPGARYTLRPINKEGAAIAELGYHECWQPGLHRGKYPALIQTGAPIWVDRNPEKDYMRHREHRQRGWFGINQHHADDAPRSDIGTHSAGCLTTRMVLDHARTLQLKKSDPRYLANKQFVFGACIMTAAQVLDVGDQQNRPRPSITPEVPKGHKATGAGIGTGLTGTGAWFIDHWYWFALVAAIMAIGYFVYYWREPFAQPDVGSIPNA